MYKLDREDEACRGGPAHENWAPDYGVLPKGRDRPGSPHAWAHFNAWKAGAPSIGRHVDARRAKKEAIEAAEAEKYRKWKAAEDDLGGSPRQRPGDGPEGGVYQFSWQRE